MGSQCWELPYQVWPGWHHLTLRRHSFPAKVTPLQGKGSWCFTAGKGFLGSRNSVGPWGDTKLVEKKRERASLMSVDSHSFSQISSLLWEKEQQAQLCKSSLSYLLLRGSQERISASMIWQHSALHIELRNLQDVLLNTGYLGLLGVALGSQPVTCLALTCLQHLLCKHNQGCQSWPLIMLLAAQAMENTSKHRWWSCVVECKQKRVFMGLQVTLHKLFGLQLPWKKILVFSKGSALPV